MAVAVEDLVRLAAFMALTPKLLKFEKEHKDDPRSGIAQSERDKLIRELSECYTQIYYDLKKIHRQAEMKGA